MKIVTVDQMRGLEEHASAMESMSIPSWRRRGWPWPRKARLLLGRVAGSRVLVLVGPGNNGGDGLVAARHLQGWGATTTAYLLQRELADDPKLRLAREWGVSIVSDSDDLGLKILDSHLARCRLAIDAVLGTGRARPLEGVLKDALLHLAVSRKARGEMHVMALDLPSGLSADTGEIDPACPQADVTVTLGHPKVGHFRFPGAKMVGRLEVADIGIPAHLAEEIPLELITQERVDAACPVGHWTPTRAPSAMPWSSRALAALLARPTWRPRPLPE